MPHKTPYKRILLKLSGESFRGQRTDGVIDKEALSYIARQLAEVVDMGIQIGVVVGGGNIWRGAEAESEGMDRASADYAGMLATVINAVTLQDVLEREHNVDTRTLSALSIKEVAEPYIRRRAIRHLEKGRVVIFASGIGSPFVTTDTAAALRANEMETDVLLMAKHNTDGVYESDPNIDSSADKFDFLTYMDVLEMKLGVMDTTALSLCMEYELPIVVFDIFVPDSLSKVLSGQRVGTLVAENRV